MGKTVIVTRGTAKKPKRRSEAEKLTCGDCDRLEDDEGVGYCRPPSTLWQKGNPVTCFMPASRPANANASSKRASAMPSKPAAPTKPTPGPYEMTNHGDGVSIDSGDIEVAWLPADENGHVKTIEESLANAQAFIDGIAAMETLEKIRVCLSDRQLGNGYCVAEIESLLGKP